jgi:hypothetical protein
MNKKEIQKLENDIKSVFDKIEEVKKGKLLFEYNEISYYKYNKKYYSAHTVDGDCWCDEINKQELKECLEEVKEELQEDIERVVCSVRLNTLAISELYEEKIKLLELKI